MHVIRRLISAPSSSKNSFCHLSIYPVKFLSFLPIFFFFYVKLFVERVSDPGGPSQFCAVCPRVPSWILTADALPSPGRDTDLPG